MLKSKRLTYRKYQKHELDAYLKVAMNEEVMAYITGYSLDEDEAAERFRTILNDNEIHPVLGCYHVSRREDDAYIGTSKLTPLNGETAECEIGYALLPEYWGNGYSSEMVETLLELAREIGIVGRIIGIVDPGNEVSIHILEKYGFTKYDEGKHYDLPAWYYKKDL